MENGGGREGKKEVLTAGLNRMLYIWGLRKRAHMVFGKWLG